MKPLGQLNLALIDVFGIWPTVVGFIIWLSLVVWVLWFIGKDL